MTTTMPASTTLAWYRNVGIGLLVAAGLVLLIGWPRSYECGDFAGPTCEPESGSVVVAWIGLAVGVASLFPLVVYAVGVGAGLALRAEREAAGTDQKSRP